MTRQQAAVVHRPALRLVLVDDHAIVLHGLRSVLADEAGVRIVGQARDAPTALRVIAEVAPDLCLLDLRLGTSGSADGLALCSDIVRRWPAVGVIVLTAFLDAHLITAAVRAGARGYVLKDIDPAELVGVCEDVHRGDVAFDRRAAAALANSDPPMAPASRADRLTPRQRQVAERVAAGASNDEIARALGIAPSTVKFHVRGALRRLNVTRRTELVAAVLAADRHG